MQHLFNYLPVRQLGNFIKIPMDCDLYIPRSKPQKIAVDVHRDRNALADHTRPQGQQAKLIEIMRSCNITANPHTVHVQLRARTRNP